MGKWFLFLMLILYAVLFESIVRASDTITFDKLKYIQMCDTLEKQDLIIKYQYRIISVLQEDRKNTERCIRGAVKNKTSVTNCLSDIEI